MALQFQGTSDIALVNHCLVYGRAKTGKTRLLATAPNMVICSSDQGLASIREFNLPYHQVNTYADYLVFENHAKDGQLNGYTVGLDDLTELAEMFLLVEKPKHKNALQAYGALNDEMMRVIRFWRSQQSLTAVIICKQERIEDTSTGGLIFSPDIPGKKVAPALPYLFGSVYHMEEYTNPKDQSKMEVLRTKCNPQFDAGDRSGKLAELEPANLTHIFNKVLS